MSSPWKHPTTGFYYVRKSIPARLRPKFENRHELKKSLGTKDPRKAKELFLPELARVEAMIRAAETSETSFISQQRCLALAGHWLKEALHQDEVYRETKGTPELERRELPDDHSSPYDDELSHINDLENFEQKVAVVEADAKSTLETFGEVIPAKESES